MNCEDIEFSLEYDGEPFSVTVNGYDLLGQIWKPEGSPRYVYIFIHGLGGFVTLNRDFYPLITNDGGIVYACDHIGCGKSPGSRTSNTVDDNISETLEIISLCKEKHPDLPIVIHGHSMGGLTAIVLGLTKFDEINDKVKCIIAEAPWLSKCPQRDPGFIEQAGIRVLNWVWPTCQVPLGFELFSSNVDKRFVDLVSKSPLFSTKITPRLFLNVEESQKFANENKFKWPPSLPLLYQQGTGDNMVDPQLNQEWIRELLESKEKLNIVFKAYENAPHYILKSQSRAQASKDILEFINQHL